MSIVEHGNNLLGWGALIVGAIIVIGFILSLVPNGTKLFDIRVFIGLGAVMFMVVGLMVLYVYSKPKR